MDISEETKKEIDEMSYEELLFRWRIAEREDKIFQGEAGSYYTEVMQKKRNMLSNSEQVAISKKIGWH